MHVEDLIAFRDKAKELDQQIFVYCDNALTFYDGLRDAEYLIWDDEHEVLRCIGPLRDTCNNGFYRRAEHPYEIYVFDYDQIQGIGVWTDYKGLSKELSELSAKGLITSEQMTEMIKQLAPLSKANVAPLERTMRTMTPEEYKKSLEDKK